MLDAEPQIAFYADWKFWSFAASALAIALSQLPPVRLWFRKPKVRIESYSSMPITHDVGSPHAQLHLMISNVGGGRVRILGLDMVIRRDGIEVCTLPAMSYLKESTDTTAALFVSMRLEPGEDWAHIVNFFAPRGRQEDQAYRRMSENLRSDIRGKRTALEDQRQNVAADDEIVEPLLNLFAAKFVWLPGDYELSIRARTDPPAAMQEHVRQFTFFESDTEQLRSHTNDYRFGFGVILKAPDRIAAIVPLRQPQAIG